MKQPDITYLTSRIGLATKLIGFYDAPNTTPFEPLIKAPSGKRPCVFAFYQQWLRGITLRIDKDHLCCGGAGYWLSGVPAMPRDNFVGFLVDEEGLKASHALMNQWLECNKPYRQEHSNIMIGPLKEDQYEYLKTVTFYVNPAQMSALILGAQYNSAPNDTPCVIAPFGSGCMQLAPLFNDFNVPQAIIGATDIAMRHFLPPDILAFTITKPMFRQLSELDEHSFLNKPFWDRLTRTRRLTAKEK